MEWRIVTSSSPIRTSRTTSRMICWRCSTVRFSPFAGEARAEPVERFGELEVGLGVVQLGVERVELGLKGGFAFA
jgi:hypothetical protein